MNLGKRILQVRKNLKLTQKDFAKELRIDKGHVANIENNSRRPSEHLIHLICLKYSVLEDWLKTGQGEMFISPEEIIKNQIARFDKRAILEAINNLNKEQNILPTAFITKESQIPYATNPELERMYNTLHLLWISGDERFKNWVSVQFDRAFPKDVIEEAQKKQKESLGQASVS